MSRNGSGTYSLPEPAFVAGTTIDQTPVNNNFSDIAAALTASLAKDGQTTPTANLPMGSFKHTGVADGSARTHYLAMGQAADDAANYAGTSGGTADAQTLSPSPAITAYAAGQRFSFLAGATNTGAMTINVSSVGAKNVKMPDGTDPDAGAVTTGNFCEVRYDGTNLVLLWATTPASIRAYIDAQQSDAELDALAGLTSAANKVPRFTGSGTADLLDFKDEDDMSSDSATAVASQQSIKAYVDATALAQGDLLDTSSGTSVNTSTLGKASPSVIVLIFDNVSLDGTDDILVQIGPSGGVDTSGYTSASETSSGAGAPAADGFFVRLSVAAAALQGTMVLRNTSGNVWIEDHTIFVSGSGANVSVFGGGRLAASGAVTQVTVKPDGSDNFDGGQIRIQSY